MGWIADEFELGLSWRNLAFATASGAIVGPSGYRGDLTQNRAWYWLRTNISNTFLCGV